MNNLRLILRSSAIAGVAAILGMVACSPAVEPPHASVKADSQRKAAPDFALKDANGNLVHLVDYRGKVVLLDFWATWCGPCEVEIPWFMEFQSKYKDFGFEVLGVSLDDQGWKAISPYMSRKRINYRILLGDDATGDLFGGLEALPTTFVIDRSGRIAAAHVGLTSRKDFEDAIQTLLKAPAPSARASAGDGPAHRAG